MLTICAMRPCWASKSGTSRAQACSSGMAPLVDSGGWMTRVTSGPIVEREQRAPSVPEPNASGDAWKTGSSGPGRTTAGHSVEQPVMTVLNVRRTQTPGRIDDALHPTHRRTVTKNRNRAAEHLHQCEATSNHWRGLNGAVEHPRGASKHVVQLGSETGLVCTIRARSTNSPRGASRQILSGQRVLPDYPRAIAPRNGSRLVLGKRPLRTRRGDGAAVAGAQPRSRGACSGRVAGCLEGALVAGMMLIAPSS